VGTNQIAAEICSKALDNCSEHWKVPIQALSAACDDNHISEEFLYPLFYSQPLSITAVAE
jgi:hypothetical protein